MLIVIPGGNRPRMAPVSIPLALPVPPGAVSAALPLRIQHAMGQLSAGHLVIILVSIAMWIGAAWVVVIAARKMGLFGRKPK
jgi:hypothetical protein